MSEVATATAGQAVVAVGGDAGKTKSPTKKKATVAKGAGAANKKKHVVDHPKYSEMVHQALGSLKERGGSSRQAVLKYIMKNFNVGKDENIVNTHLKIALRSGVKNATLKQSKGSGATGSFRLGEEAKKSKPKAAATTGGKKTTAAKKPKATTIKVKKAKTAAAEKSVKSPAKKMAKKSTSKTASSAKVASSKPKAAKTAAAKKVAKTADKPKKAAPAVSATKKVKTEKPKKSTASKVVKKPVAKKTPVAKTAAKKPAAAAKKA